METTLFPRSNSNNFAETTRQRKVRKKTDKEKQLTLLVFLKCTFLSALD